MTKNIRLGIKRLKEELNSEAFLSGLEAVLNYSLNAGNEAHFNVYYFPKLGIFGYPDYIILGDATSVLPSRIDTKKTVEYISKLVESAGVGNGPNMDRRLEYPQSEDFKRKNEKTESVDSESIPAILVHTHPKTRIAYPSGGDLAALNAERDSQRFIEGIAYVKETKCNPLGIIVPTIKFGREHRVLMFQEKSNIPFPLDTDFEELSDKFYESESDPENVLRALMSPGKYPDIDAIKQRYNISHNYFNPSGKYWNKHYSMDGFLPIVK